MSKWTKKFLVLLPVVALGFFYLYDHYETYEHVRSKRLIFLALSLLILYGWFFIEVITRKQENFFAGWSAGKLLCFHFYGAYAYRLFYFV